MELLTWSKLVTMNMEVVQTAQEHLKAGWPPSSRAKILGDFVSKLRASGYLQSTVEGDAPVGHQVLLQEAEDGSGGWTQVECEDGHGPGWQEEGQGWRI